MAVRGGASPDAGLTSRFYRMLFRIRRVEEEVARVYPTDKIKSPIHLSIGQEAVSVGVCAALRETDVVFATLRGHAAYLAKGGDLKKMIAELYGKATGCAKGKGGSMHLIDAAAGIMSTGAIIGTIEPQAVGYAWALKLRGKNDVAVSFSGDGAWEEGSVFESLNFAALKRVPVIYICENNNLAIHSRLGARQPVSNIYERVRAYGVPAERIEDMDVFKVYEWTRAAVADLRAGRPGPRFLECLTYRWREHVGPNEDFNAGYRSRSEAEPWFANDQVARLAAMVPAVEREAIEEEVLAEIRDAFDFAERSPFPEAEELYTDVFADERHGTAAHVR
ncbi:MAG: thiamine pyrophosphate-dependent dehydrogenase E1 component subunit alpha [bacterium]